MLDECEYKTYYLDNAATTKMYEESFREMEYVNRVVWANPSSYHKPGFSAKDRLEYYKCLMCDALGVGENELFFTSGGTESNNWAIKGAARMMARDHNRHTILCSKMEHPSVLNACLSLEKEGFHVKYINALPCGRIDMKHFRSLIDNDLALVCVMRANNETGVIETSIREIADLTHLFGGLYMCDAVQAVGKIDNSKIKQYGADFVSFSAHKFHGPKGVGGLYIKNGMQIDNLIDGGGQQEGRRSGTESIMLIGGMATALSKSTAEQQYTNKRKKKFIDKFIELAAQKIDGFVINGAGEKVPGVINMSVENVDGDMLQIALNLNGIFVSNGSACHAGDPAPSHVLSAMSVDKEYILSAIRITVGDEKLYDSDVEFIVNTLSDCVNNVREMQRLELF